MFIYVGAAPKTAGALTAERHATRKAVPTPKTTAFRRLTPESLHLNICDQSQIANAQFRGTQYTVIKILISLLATCTHQNFSIFFKKI